jgi:hypothetical protein
VIGPARDRTHEQELVEHQLSVIEVALGQAVDLFQIEGREGF